MNIPGVIFAMRYPNNVGYVWNTIAKTRDIAAGYLNETASCFIAYPILTNTPAYQPHHLSLIELDCYDASHSSLIHFEHFIKTHNVKVVVFMSALPSTLNLSFFRRLGVRTINTENDSFDHSKRDPWYKKFPKYIIRRILKRQLHDLHLANAESQQRFLERYALIPQDRIALVRDGVDCKRFTPGDRYSACLAANLDTECLWILSASQMRSEKRIDLIIQSAKKIIDAQPMLDIRFIHVGDGPELIPCQALVKSLKLEKKFLFAGSQTDLVPYYQAASLFIHASKRESFGLVIVEAMACRLPIVATFAAGPGEIILENSTGTLVTTNDEDGFVKAIMRYVNDENLRHLHGTNGRRRACNIFDIDRQGKQMAEHIAIFARIDHR